MKKVVVTGGTGFIGSRLVKLLDEKGYDVILIGRHAPKKSDYGFITCDLAEEIPASPLFDHVHGVIHLAGRPIFARWSDQVKEEIYDSRVKGAQHLFAAFKAAKGKPKVFVSASAAGFYGDRGDEQLEESAGPGKGFLAKVCRDWEKEAEHFEELGSRWVSVRTALVLGEGGLLKLLVPIFQWGLGGPIAGGKQWMPWIHVDDLVQAYVAALENDKLEGPVNVCAPEQVTNKTFSKTLGTVMRRPAFVPVFRWMLWVVFGEFGREIVKSQRAVPAKLKKIGFQWKFPALKDALWDCVKSFQKSG